MLILAPHLCTQGTPHCRAIRCQAIRATVEGMQQERRSSKQVSVLQAVSISLGNGGGVATAVSDNVSYGGATGRQNRRHISDKWVLYIEVHPAPAIASFYEQPEYLPLKWNAKS